MASNDDLLVSIGADFTQLRKDLATAERYFQEFSKDVAAMARRQDFLGDLSTQGRHAAASLVGGLESEFRASSTQLKDQLARNTIDQRQFSILGTRAAEEFNKSLAAGIDDLDAQGLLPPGLKTELVAQFKDIGESSAKQMADALADRIQKIGGGIQSAGRTIATTIGVPLAALGVGAIKAEEDIDDALDRLRITTGATGDNLADLQTQFESLFGNIPSSAKDVSTAIAELSVRTSAHGEDLKTLTNEYLTLSRLLGTDVKANIENTQKLFNQFGVGVGAQGTALDFLFKTAQRTGVGFDSLAADMTRFGPTLRQLGFNFKQSAALIAQFSREGVDVDTILNRMSLALASFAKRGIAAPDALNALITQIKKADTDTRAINIAANVFGSRGAAGFAAAVREGRISFEDLMRTIDASPETIRAAAAETDGFKESLITLRAQAEKSLAPLGDDMVRAFRDLQPSLVSATRIVIGLARTFASLPENVRNGALAFAAIGIALGPVLIGVGSLVTGIGSLVRVMPSVISAISALAGAEGLAALASLLLPGGIILVGLGLIATAIYQSGAAARSAARDMDAYTSALQGLGPAALGPLFQSTQEMEKQVNFLKKQREEIKRIEGESTTVPTRSDLGSGEVVIKNPKIADIDRQLERLNPALEAARHRFLQLLDAELRTETGAHGLNTALGNVKSTATGISGLDIDFGSKIATADQQISALLGNVRSLLGAFKEIKNAQATQPELVDRLFEAQQKVTTLLGRQKDQYSSASLALANVKRDLEGVEAVQLRILRSRFQEIDNAFPQLAVSVPELSVDTIKVQPQAVPKLVIPVEKIALSATVVSDFQRALSAEMRATGTLDAAQLFGKPDQIQAAAKGAAEAAEVLRAAMRALRTDIENSQLPIEVQKKILDDMGEAARKAGLQSKAMGDSVGKAVSTFDTFITIGRGLTNILGSIRGINQAVVAMTRSVVDSVEAFKQLSVARKTGDTLGAIGGTIGVIGGLIQFGTQLADMLNADRKERERLQKETNDIIKTNNEALDALRVKQEGFTGSVGDLSEILRGLTTAPTFATKPGVRTAIPRLVDGSNIPTGLGTDQTVRKLFDESLRGVGTSLRELEQFAKSAGITLFNSAGEVIPQAFKDLQEAIELTIDQMIHFQNTLEDQRSIQDLVQDVFDIDQTPIQKINNELGLVAKLAPQLFDTFFKGIDTSTEAGRAQLETSLRALVLALRDGTIDIASFGELMGKGELGEILRNADNALDELGKSALEAATNLVNVPTGFAVSKRVFEAITATLNAAADAATTPNDAVVQAIAQQQDITGSMGTLTAALVDQTQVLPQSMDSLTAALSVLPQDLQDALAALQVRVGGTDPNTIGALVDLSHVLPQSMEQLIAALVALPDELSTAMAGVQVRATGEAFPTAVPSTVQLDPAALTAMVNLNNVLPQTLGNLVATLGDLPRTITDAMAGIQVSAIGQADPQLVAALVDLTQVLPRTMADLITALGALPPQIGAAIAGNQVRAAGQVTPTAVAAAVQVDPAAIAALVDLETVLPQSLGDLVAALAELPPDIAAALSGIEVRATGGVDPVAIAAIVDLTTVLPQSMALLTAALGALPQAIADAMTGIQIRGVAQVDPASIAALVDITQVLPASVATLVATVAALPQGIADAVSGVEVRSTGQVDPVAIGALVDLTAALPRAIDSLVSALATLPTEIGDALEGIQVRATGQIDPTSIASLTDLLQVLPPSMGLLTTAIGDLPPEIVAALRGIEVQAAAPIDPASITALVGVLQILPPSVNLLTTAMGDLPEEIAAAMSGIRLQSAAQIDPTSMAALMDLLTRTTVPQTTAAGAPGSAAPRPNVFNFDFGGITIPGPIGANTNIQELLTRLREALIAKLRTINPQSVEAFLKIWPA